MFVTDTVDAIYRPNDWFPEAMMDQLAEIAGSLPRVCVLLRVIYFSDLPVATDHNYNYNKRWYNQSCT